MDTESLAGQLSSRVDKGMEMWVPKASNLLVPSATSKCMLQELASTYPRTEATAHQSVSITQRNREIVTYICVTQRNVNFLTSTYRQKNSYLGNPHTVECRESHATFSQHEHMRSIEKESPGPTLAGIERRRKREGDTGRQDDHSTYQEKGKRET